jgi:magnesium chelatase family protein
LRSRGSRPCPVDVQVQIAPGGTYFGIVGLPTRRWPRAASGCKAALHASGLSLPARRITINLAPADLPKEGSHYDLPIALGLMAALGALPGDALADYVVLGELVARRHHLGGRRACCRRRSAPMPRAGA